MIYPELSSTPDLFCFKSLASHFFKLHHYQLQTPVNLTAIYSFLES